MDDRTNKAFDLLVEAIKQLIALATGIVALTVTFEGNATLVGAPGWLFIAAWLLYLLSVIAGIATLLTITSLLHPNPTAGKSARPSIWFAAARTKVCAQIILFVTATALIVAYGVASLPA